MTGTPTSTERNRPCKITARLEPRGSHTDIHIWVNGAKAGVLTVREEEVWGVLNALVSSIEPQEGGAP
jgi:hypothetical protein